MYWADKITQSKPIKSQKLFEGGEFSVVHLSSAIVENCGEKDRVKLVGKLGKGDDITLASLSRTNDTAKLDFYINCTQQVTLSVHGGNDKTEVHLSGYFEPNGEDQEDDMFYGEEAEEGEEDLEEDDDEEFEPKKASLTQSLKQAKINSNKNASAKIVASDSDDESDVVSDEEEDDSSDDIPVVPKQKQPPAAPVKKVVEDSDDESEERDSDAEELSEDDDDELVDDVSDDDDDEEADLEAIMKKAKETQQRLKLE
jgi:nucleophosmin 1